MLKPAIISELQLGSIKNTEEGIIFAQKRIRELENTLLYLDELLDKSLYLFINHMKDRQQRIFIESINLLNRRIYSLNKLSEKIAKKLDISFSTAKWNITRFRDLGLFETNGQRGDTNTTIATTELGKTLYSAFARSQSNNL